MQLEGGIAATRLPVPGGGGWGTALAMVLAPRWLAACSSSGGTAPILNGCGRGLRTYLTLHGRRPPR